MGKLTGFYVFHQFRLRNVSGEYDVYEQVFYLNLAYKVVRVEEAISMEQEKVVLPEGITLDSAKELNRALLRQDSLNVWGD